MKAHHLVLLFAVPAIAVAAPVHYQPPPETAKLAPGADRDMVQGICATCHSVDYIVTQPRSFPDMRAFWTAEVAKMRAPYGAPIDDAQVAKIVDYLAAAYGK